MRLWPLAILKQLPNRQLLGQHRECCALRGKGWGKKHSTVNYVFKHPYAWLWFYHKAVIKEMCGRGYSFDPKWLAPPYRGKEIGFDNSDFIDLTRENIFDDFINIYPEHDRKYLKECIENLAEKGIKIEMPLSSKNITKQQEQT